MSSKARVTHCFIALFKRKWVGIFLKFFFNEKNLFWSFYEKDRDKNIDFITSTFPIKNCLIKPHKLTDHPLKTSKNQGTKLMAQAIDYSFML